MINYTWSIINVIVNPSVTVDSTTYENVVEEIIWRCTGVETGTNTTAYEEQTWSIKFKDPSSFVEFDDLDTNLVLSWLYALDPHLDDVTPRLVAGKIEKLNNTKEVEG